MNRNKNIQLFENHPAGLSITNISGKILDANQAMIRIFGFSGKEELLNTNVSELYYDINERKQLLSTLEQGPIKNFVIKGKHKSGQMLWLSVSSDSLTNEEGVTEFIDIVDDITDRINSQEKILQYSQLFEDSINEIYIFETTTLKFLECNRAAKHNLGYTFEELAGMTPVDINPDFDPDYFNGLIEPLRTGQKQKIVFNTHHRRKDNSIYPVEAHIQKSAFNNKNTFTAIILDISERVNTEKALKASEEKYKAIVETQTEYIYRWKPDGTRTFVNKRYADYYGQQAEDLIGTSFVAQINPESWKQLRERISLLTPEDPVSVNEHKTTFNGKEIWKEWTDRAFFNDDGELEEIQSVGRDITNRKVAEEKLVENQVLLRASLESIGEGILVVDNKGTVIHYNSVFLAIWGIPEAFVKANDDDALLGYVLKQLKNPDQFLKKVKELYQSADIDFDVLEFNDGRIIERKSYPLIIRGSMEGRVWSFLDATEQYKAEEQIRESEARFKQLIENLPDAIFVSEIGGPDKGKILNVNQTAEIQTGYSRDELIGKNIGEDLLEMADQEKFEEDERKLLNSGKLRLTEKKKKKDGTMYWVEVMVATIYQEGRTMALSVNRDITELKKSEQELRESRQNLLMIYETAGVNLLHIGVGNESEYYIRSANNMYLQTIGKALHEVENKKIEEVLDPEASLLAKEKFNEAIKKRSTLRWEETVVYPSGKKWGAVSATPVFDETGKCIGIIEVIHDITEKKEIETNIIQSQEELEKLVQSRTIDLEKSRKAAMNLLQDSNEQRKRAEEALDKLKESNAEIRKLSQAVEQNPAAVIIIDTNGFIEYVNRFYCEKTGYSPSEIIGPNPEKMVSSNTLPSKRKDIWDTISGGNTWNGEIQNSAKDGSTFWESISISPLFDENKSILGYVRVGQDISQRKQLEEDLTVAKEMADEATRAKSEFLANMSHEIRTPMNAILGFADLLSMSVADPNAKNYLQSLKTSGKSLLNLINDILDLSKVEAGMLQLSYDFIDLRQLFDEIRQIFTLELAEKKINLILEIDPSLPAGIFLDEARLRQVMINLVNNAVKFTEKGSITLRASFSEDYLIQPNQKNYSINLIIEVIDTGIGITDEFQKIIFDSFTQYEGYDTKKYGGTGLGLTISQKIVGLMNGYISLQSKVGQGSTFTIVLDNTIVTNLPVHKEIKEEIGLDDIIFEPQTILVVDDVEENVSLLSGIIEHAGLRTITAGNGRKAIELLKTTTPDLIITDIKMPELDGFGLLSFIRKSEVYKHIPVISSSASVLEDSEKSVRDIKFDGFINKPIQIPELLIELKKFISHKIVRSNTRESLKPGYFISELTAEKSEQLRKMITEELMPLYEQIKTRQPVKKVEQFGKLLIQCGNKYQLEGFTNYGNDIAEAIRSFNVEGIVRLIRLFPEIIEPIKITKSEI